MEARQLQLFPIGNLPEENLLVKILGHLLAQDHFTDGPHMLQGFLAGGHGEGAGIALLRHGGAHRPDHPGGAQDMIRMAVGDEHPADGGNGHPQLVQPHQHLIPAPGIHQQAVGILLQEEAGIVTFQNHGTACAEKGCFHRELLFCLIN